MSSAHFFSISDPISAVYGGVKLVLVGVASGTTYAFAAVQTNPEIAAVTAPSLEKSFYFLAFAVLLAAGKSYLPSEKKVDQQFNATQEELKSGHKSLVDKLEEMAHGNKEEAEERRNHYRMLHTWMGRTDERLDRIESRTVTGEIKRV